MWEVVDGRVGDLRKRRCCCCCCVGFEVVDNAQQGVRRIGWIFKLVSAGRRCRE